MMGAYHAFLATMSLLILKGCTLFQDGQQSDQMKGLTIPFYQSSTIEIPIKPEEQPKVDSNKQVLYNAHLHLLRKLMRGDLSGYKTTKLSESYSVENIRSRADLKGYKPDNESFSNENFRKNFIKHIDKQRFYAYRLNLKWDWNDKKQMGRVRLHSLTPYFKPTRGGTSLGPQPLASFKYPELLKQLPKSLKSKIQEALQKNIFERIQQSEVNDELLTYKARSRENPGSISKRSLHFRKNENLEETLGKQFDKFNQKLIKSARKGEIEVYHSDSLKRPFSSKEAVKQQGASKEVIEIIKGSGADKYYADTTIYDQLQPENINRYWLLERWQQEKTGLYKLKALALAPVYRPVRGGVELGGVSLFWLKMSDMQSTLSPAELSWIKAFGFLEVQQQLAEAGYKL